MIRLSGEGDVALILHSGMILVVVKLIDEVEPVLLVGLD